LHSDFALPPDCGETSYVGTSRLRGRRALITGGDSGIGRAVAIAFAREGANVVINYLPGEQSDADDVASIIGSTTNSSIFTLPGDLRNETFCAELVRESADLLGGLDILINNAGYSRAFDDIANLSTASFTRTMQTNIFAPMFLTRAAASLMPPGSAIVFTSSVITQAPAYRLADYAASKAFLLTFSQALAVGLMQTRGIKVNAVRPAITYTPFLPSQGQTAMDVMSQGRTNPLGRVQQPVDIAPQFVAMVANDAAYSSGGFF
jgi:NAD(P)-dependent dehydrogenase (short-subunit alcohol dehydrogenase family)